MGNRKCINCSVNIAERRSDCIRCKKCQRAYNTSQWYQRNKKKISLLDKERYKKNKDKRKAQRKKHYRDNKEKTVMQMKRYYECNKSSIRSFKRKWEKKCSQELTDGYIKHLLRSKGNTIPLKASEVPFGLIKLKRRQLLARRMLYNK